MSREEAREKAAEIFAKTTIAANPRMVNAYREGYDEGYNAAGVGESEMDFGNKARDFHYRHCIGRIDYTDNYVISLLSDFANEQTARLRTQLTAAQEDNERLRRERDEWDQRASKLMEECCTANDDKRILSAQLTAARAERDEAIKKTLGDFSEEYSVLKWQNHEDGQTIHRLKSDLANLRSLLAGATEISSDSWSILKALDGSYYVLTAARSKDGFETIEQAFSWIQEQV